MNVLITYDIKSVPNESKDTEVKDGMKALGYMQSYSLTKDDKTTTYYLPNTTLWKQNTSPQKAKQDLQSVALRCKAEVERLIAVEWNSNWDAIPGKAYASK